MLKPKDGRFNSPTALKKYLKSLNQVTVRIAMFSLRIVTVDWYSNSPSKGYDHCYSEFRGGETYKVPIIRIFGVTPKGQKACLHVHGVYPYLMLRWKDVFPGIDIKDSHKYLQELALEIDKALHVAGRKSNSSQHHVFKIAVEEGFCFYGYHGDEERFLKVFFYDPYDINRSADLLTNGAIRNKQIQPHKAHFPFILQFFADFNLSGMNLINVSEFHFRAPRDTQFPEQSSVTTQNSLSLFDDSNSVDGKWNIDTLSSFQISEIPKQTTCELELDCSAKDILNKSVETACVGENPGIAAIWAEERMRRKAENDNSILTPVPSQDRVNAFETESEIRYKSMLQSILDRLKLKCDNQPNKDLDNLHTDSQYSILHSSINLSNTQDMQVLGDLLSMANNNDPENDSILGCVAESDSEEETVAMSQKFTPEPWTPQVLDHEILEKSPSSMFEHDAVSVPQSSASPIFIPQLDGTYDDETYEEFSPILIKENKACPSNSTNSCTAEFDDKPPVLQPEQPIDEQHFPNLQNKQILQCSVKVEKHPILKSIDPTKPVLLTCLQENGHSLLLSKEKSTDFPIASSPDIKVTKSKKISKSQRFENTIQKCVSSVISKVEKLAGNEKQSSSIHTNNAILEYSNVQINKVSKAVAECPKTDLQRSSKSQLTNSSVNNMHSNGRKSTSKDSPESKSLKTQFSNDVHKPKKDKFKLSCDQIKPNNDLQTKSHKDKNHSNSDISESKLPASNNSTTPNSGVKEFLENSKSDNNFSKTKDAKKSKEHHLSILDSNSSKKHKHSKHKSKLTVTKQVVDSDTTQNSSFSPQIDKYAFHNMPRDVTINFKEIESFQPINFSQLGKEIVRVERMTEAKMATYLKQSSVGTMIGQESKAFSKCSTKQPDLKSFDKVKHRTKQTNAVSGTKYCPNRLTSEDKAKSKSKNPSHSFKSSITDKHSSLSMSNDFSDFKNPSNMGTPNKNIFDFNHKLFKSKLLSPTKVQKAVIDKEPSHKLSKTQKEKKSSSNLKEEMCNYPKKKTFPHLEVSTKRCEKGKKEVIEKQVQFSLEDANEVQEIECLANHKVVTEIDLTHDQDCSDQKTSKDVAMIPDEFRDRMLQSLKVNLVQCSDLIKKYCPENLPKSQGYSKKVNPTVLDAKVSKPSIPEPKSHPYIIPAHQIKVEKEDDLPAYQEFLTPTKLPFAIKSEPLPFKETSEYKNGSKFNSTIDASLPSSSVLPYAVKSKPVHKNDISSSVTCTSDTGIYAVKSKPTIKTPLKPQTYVKASPNKSVVNVPVSNSSTNSKLLTKNKLSISDNSRTDNRVMDYDSDFKASNHGKMKNIRPENVLPSSIRKKNTDESKVKGTLMSDVKTENVGKTKTSPSPIIKCDSTTGKNIIPESMTPKSRKKGFDFKSPIIKNSETSQNKKQALIKEKYVTINMGNYNSKLKSPNAINNSIDLALEAQNVNSSEIKEKSPNLSKNKSKSLDLPNTTDMLSVGKGENYESKTPSNLNSSDIHPSNVSVKFQNKLKSKSIDTNNDCKVLTSTTAPMLSFVENDLYDNVKRRTAKKDNLIAKSNMIGNADKMLNNISVDKVLPSVKSARVLRKRETNPIIDTIQIDNDCSTSLASTTKVVIETPIINVSVEHELPSLDKPLVLSSKENASIQTKNKSACKDLVSTNIILNGDTNCNFTGIPNSVQTRNKSACKDLVSANKIVNGDSDFKSSDIQNAVQYSVQTRNKSACKDSLPSNDVLNDDAKYKDTTIANIESPKTPLSLVPKERKRNIGKELNNFGYFSNKNSKKRRNSPETVVTPKPLSSKLSLKHNKTKINIPTKVKTISPFAHVTKRKEENYDNLHKDTSQKNANTSEDSIPESFDIQQESSYEKNTADLADMKEALSRFDFDENGTEPTTSLSYTSKRNLRNSAKRENTLAYQKRKHKKSPKHKKHCSVSYKKSAGNSLLNVLTAENVNQTIEQISTAEVIPKIKIMKSTTGHSSQIVLPSNTSESFLAPSNGVVQLENKSRSEEKRGTFVGLILKKVNSETFEVFPKKDIEVFDISDDDSGTEDCNIKKNIKNNGPYVKPSHPLVPPIILKNIKKEKIDDYEKPHYVSPVKFKKSEDNEKNWSIVAPCVSAVPVKRGRGRPRKTSKVDSPIKNIPSLCDVQATLLPVPKKSAALSSLEIDRMNSFQIPMRRTRSNSARVDISFDFSNVKVKQEPISEGEDKDVEPTNAIPEYRPAIKTRSKSLMCEDSIGILKDNLDHIKEKVIKLKSPKKNRQQSKEAKNQRASGNSDSEECIKKSPKKRKLYTHKPKVNSETVSREVTKRRASAASSYKEFFDSSSDSDIQVVHQAITPIKQKVLTKCKQSSPSKRSRKAKDEENADPPEDSRYKCQVVMQRLLPSEIEKHCSDSHTVDMGERESQSDQSSESPATSHFARPSGSNRSNTSFDSERLALESLQLRMARGQELESILASTEEEAAMKLVADTPESLRKLASTSSDSGTDSLQDNILRENNIAQLISPIINTDTITQPGYTPREPPPTEVEILTPVSTPENLMVENLKSDAEQCSAYSPGLHKGVTPTFLESWDSPPGLVPTNPTDVKHCCVDNVNSPMECDCLTPVIESPEILKTQSNNELKHNNFNVVGTAVNQSSPTQPKVEESSIIPKKRYFKNPFDTVAEEMNECIGITNIFNSVENVCLPRSDLSETKSSCVKNPGKINQTNKLLKKDYGRSQANQTVSCFKGYDLQSEAAIISPSHTKKQPTIADMQDTEKSSNSFASNGYGSILTERKSHSQYNSQNNSKQDNSFNSDFFDYYNTLSMPEELTSMQLDTNQFPNCTNSYMETNKSRTKFSIAQNKCPNSHCDIKTNMQANNSTFSETGWDNVNKYFDPIDNFQKKALHQTPISVQKEPGDHNTGFFNRTQFDDSKSNYFPSDDTRRIWSPAEQVKCDNFDKPTKLLLPDDPLSRFVLDSSQPFMPHQPMQSKSHLIDSLQGTHMSDRISVLEASDSVEGFTTNSPSSLSSQKSGVASSPYYMNNDPSSHLSNHEHEEAIKSFSESLSDILAGSSLDMETSVNSDTFTASTAPESVSATQVAETDNYRKNDSLAINGNDKVSSIRKCDESKLSPLPASTPTFQSLDFSDFTDDNDLDNNLFGEMTYTNSPVQTQTCCEPSYEGTEKKKVEHSNAGQVKNNNLLLSETFLSTTTSSSSIASSLPCKAPVVSFENNIIPLATLNTPPSDDRFTQLPMPAFNNTSQAFLSTLMVGEPVMVPQSNLLFNNASVIINKDSTSQDYVNILPNSEPATIGTVSKSETNSSQESSSLKPTFGEGEDILSMIVKSCAIGEEFDENLDSPSENINESLTNESIAFNSKINSFYGDNTMFDLNQTNTEAFCSNVHDLNRRSEASLITETKDCLQNINKKSSQSDFQTSNSSVITGDKFIKTEIPCSKGQSLAFGGKSDGSNKNYASYPKPRRKTNGTEFFNSTDEPSSEDSRSSDSVKAKLSDKKLKSYCPSSKPNCSSQLQNRLQRLPNHLLNANFLSGDNLESTPSSNRHEIRKFLPQELSPINKDNLLTSDTLKRKRLTFESTPGKSKKTKKQEKHNVDGSFTWLWENTLLADRLLDLDQNLSKSDLDGPSLENSRGYKINVEELCDARVRHEVQHLTIMSLEVHVNTRNDLRPDPRVDSVAAIFYSIYKDVGFLHQETVGIIAVDNSSLKTNSFHGTHASLKNFLSLSSCVEKSDVCCVKNENELFQKLISFTRESDPDILVGYEIQMASWGYLIERAGILNINLSSKLSRVLNAYDSRLQQIDQDPTVTDQTADLDKMNIPGRIVLNLWRLLRKEVNLNVYTFENVYYHLLHKRTPLYSFRDLTTLFDTGLGRKEVVSYYATRVVGCLQFLEKFDLIRRTSELARLFGIQFYEVLSRGSQFRVESMMLRSASPMRYVPVTPSVQQRSRMRAPETAPLILEPESKYYKDPVLVLDFQSLYPSMIIAYNYCFSTCLGRVEHLGKEESFDFGCTSLNTSPEDLQKLAEEDNIHFSPNGVAFVKRRVRRGILPTMLEEILDARVMVKKAMKKIKGNPALKKLLDARQMGLKLIANVTYGYTGANYSGRMPCVEVADSIVAKGRETLERAIKMIVENPVWNARATYGDTDSIFVQLPGRTMEEAFRIGQEIVEAVTAANPKPVKLKLEKVYYRCVLQSKKRYVGLMYETVDQAKPVFDAKGIETVRRDSCPATAKTFKTPSLYESPIVKGGHVIWIFSGHGRFLLLVIHIEWDKLLIILEKALKTLFRTDNVNLVQHYVQKQFRKLLAGRVNMTNLIFAKEYRGMAGYRPTACVPALEIAKKRLTKDPRSEPRVGERVPYVVVYGFPGMPIIKLVHEPMDLLKDPNLRINTTYYITRVISPPLDRVFSLMGHDVKTWYNNISRGIKINLPLLHNPGHQRETITQYFASRNCPSCEKNTNSPVCEACRQNPQETVITLQEKIRKWERAEYELNKICVSCTKASCSVNRCVSVDCPILFKLNLARRDSSQIPYLRQVLAQELF